jgi:hypothetical protein
MFTPTTARHTFEQAARELVRLLRDDLPDRLAELEAQAPALDLEDLAEVEVSIHTRLQYPSLEVQWIATRFPVETASQDCPEEVDAIHEFRLDLAITGEDEVALYYKLARYFKAIRATLWASGAPWVVLDEQLVEAGQLQDATSLYLRHGFLHIEVTL